jgi:hypothetical protein
MAASMVWYVALVAVLNLGLGYVMALYLGTGRQVAYAAAEAYVEDDYSYDEDELDE